MKRRNKVDLQRDSVMERDADNGLERGMARARGMREGWLESEKERDAQRARVTGGRLYPLSWY